MKRKKPHKTSKLVPSKRLGAKSSEQSEDQRDEKLVSKLISKVAVNARRRAVYHSASYTIIKDGLIIKKQPSGRTVKLGKVLKKSKSVKAGRSIKLK